MLKPLGWVNTMQLAVANERIEHCCALGGLV